MGMNEWTRYTDELSPPENQRVLVSDGDIQTIAYYVLSENHKNWFFENDSYKCLKIEWFALLPPMPPKIQEMPLTISNE